MIAVSPDMIDKLRVVNACRISPPIIHLSLCDEILCQPISGLTFFDPSFGGNYLKQIVSGGPLAQPLCHQRTEIRRCYPQQIQGCMQSPRNNERKLGVLK